MTAHGFGWFARMLGVSLVTAWTPAHGLEHFDACAITELQGSPGTVETVREVPVVRDLHAFDSDVLAHSVRPETDEEVSVRLDAGPLLVLTGHERRGLSAGQRVRVRLTGRVTRLERDWSECATPLANAFHP